MKFYFSPHCPYCKEALKHIPLDSNIEKINVFGNSDFKKELLDKTFTIMLPTIIHGDKIIEGFDEETYKELFSK